MPSRPLMSAIWGNSENMYSLRVLPPLTLNGSDELNPRRCQVPHGFLELCDFGAVSKRRTTARASVGISRTKHQLAAVALLSTRRRLRRAKYNTTVAVISVAQDSGPAQI